MGVHKIDLNGIVDLRHGHRIHDINRIGKYRAVEKANNLIRDGTKSNGYRPNHYNIGQDLRDQGKI